MLCLGLDDNTNSVTIIIINVTIVIVDMLLRTCSFDIVLPQHTYNHMKTHTKMARNISDEINLDKELEEFLIVVTCTCSFSAKSGKCSECVSKF